MNNQAAWIKTANANPLEVGPGPVHSPGEKEVVIKVAYAAVNPADWKIQGSDFLNLPYPWVLGMDVAGEICQVGSGVTRFRPGQRVMGLCAGNYTKKPTDMAFQSYSTCLEILVCAVPDSLPYADAAVLPLGVSTAASGLYMKDFLNLSLPTTSPTPNGKIIFVWGGSSSVGSCAIQLAVASGYAVFTTASAHNHAFCKSLGASKVFDQNTPGVIKDIVSALQAIDFAGGFDAISSEDTMRATAEVISLLGGGLFATTLPPPSGLPENVKAGMVSGLAPAFEAPYLGPVIWGKFLPEALARGSLQAKPDPLVVKGGLQKVQQAIDLLKKGISARKVVVEIDPTL